MQKMDAALIKLIYESELKENRKSLTKKEKEAKRNDVFTLKD